MNIQADSPAGFTRSTYTIDGVETVVHAVGDGPPLVYFHGGDNPDHFEWARDLADSFRVILPVHPKPGEGGEGDFADITDYMMHYEMVFAALELETFHLIGAASGGHLAARYAAEHGDEIDRLVLISPTGWGSAEALDDASLREELAEFTRPMLLLDESTTSRAAVKAFLLN